MNSTDYSLYMANIDPNIKIDKPLNIRRRFMFNLLFWDKLVLSDSQILTDPRFPLLVNGFESENPNPRNLEPVSKDQRGLEKLFESDLIQVAYRKKGTMEYNTEDLWNDMIKRSESDSIPFLPDDPGFAIYFDNLNSHRRIYDVSSIASLYQRNLIKGAAGVLNLNNLVEKKILDKFHEPGITQAKIKQYLTDLKENKDITDKRFNELYNYTYSCYSGNISAEIDCFTTSDLKSIPFHLDVGIGDYRNSDYLCDPQHIRPTWVLNTEAWDFVSFEDFINLKKVLNIFEDERSTIMNYYFGLLQTAADWEVFYHAWEKWTTVLESNLQQCISKKLTHKLMLCSPQVQPFQKTIFTGLMEIIVNVLGMDPRLGGALTGMNFLASGYKMFAAFSHKGEQERLRKEIERLEYLENIQLITKTYK